MRRSASLLIEEQLATLQRIVSLKDDQIAALQGALAEAGVATADKTATAVTGDVGRTSWHACRSEEVTRTSRRREAAEAIAPEACVRSSAKNGGSERQ